MNKELREYVQVGCTLTCGCECCILKLTLLQEKRAASGKVEPENPAETETVQEDGAMKKPDEPPRPAKDQTTKTQR